MADTTVNTIELRVAASSPLPRRQLVLRHATLAAVFIVAYVLLDRSTLPLQMNYGVAAWYPPTALAVALYLGVSPWYALATVVASLLSSFLNYSERPTIYDLTVIPLVITAGYSGAAVLLRGPLRLDLRLSRLRDVGWLVAVTCAAGLPVALVGVACLAVDGQSPWSGYRWSVIGWWVGDGVALLFLTPFILLYVLPWVRKRLGLEALGGEEAGRESDRRPHAVPTWTAIEIVGQALSLVAIVWVVFRYTLNSRFDLFYLCFVPILWIAVRFGLRGVALGLVALNVSVAMAFRAIHLELATLASLQLLMLTVSLTGLLLGALISERTKAAGALAGSEKRFRALIEKSYDGVGLFNAQGVFHYVSSAVTRTLGYTVEEFLGSRTFDLIHPEDAPVVKEKLARVVAKPGSSKTTEFRVRHKDGSWRWIETTATNLLSDPLVRALVCNFRDVSERKGAEEAVRRSEANYRSLVEGAPYGIYLVREDGKLLAANRALVQMLGYDSATELMKVNMSEIYRDPAERRRLGEHYQAEAKLENQEVEWKKKDGNVVTVRLTGRPVRNESGATSYYDVFAEDITQRAALEERLRQAQKMDAVGLLAGGVAHDFNNLLGVILGYSELLLGSLKPGEPSHKKLSEIHRSAQRAAGLTRQLLAFGRKQILLPKFVNLNNVIHEMRELLERLIGEHIELEARLDPRLKPVKADPGQIEQVIMNLVVNARDAMPHGGKLTIETHCLSVSEESDRDGSVPAGHYVVLTVRDTGCGMDEETKSRIFEPFFTTKRVGKGTGLGLATVYGIVRQSGGFVAVDSMPAQGAEFRIYLPEVEAEAKTDEPTRSPQQATSGDETILVVEDAAPLRELICMLLESMGYKVLVAAGGAEAIPLAERFPGPIHLLLTDLVMPGMSGREVAEQISRSRPELKVLYISGYSDEAVLPNAGSVDGTALLHKPFSRDALAQKLQEVLRVRAHK